MKKLAEKVFSRKLVAFLTATVALWLGIINQDAWEGIALAYLGAQGLVDLANTGVVALKGKAEGTALQASEAPAKAPAKSKPARKSTSAAKKSA
mgnify:CR=1 FL=1